MDLVSLAQKTFQELTSCKKNFYKASAFASKKKEFDSFVDSVEKFHKALKTSQADQASIERLKKMLRSFLNDAGDMKEALCVMEKSGPKNEVKFQGQHSQLPLPSKKDFNQKEKTEFERALKGAILAERPNVGWDEVAGLENAKQTLQEALVLPTKFPEIFVGLRKPWKSILLYGVG